MAQLSEQSISRMDRALDSVYSENPVVARGRIVEEATIQGVGDDLMFYVTELHDGDYTRQQADDAINAMIDLYGDVGHIG
jgi:hypothetical protein